MPLRIWGQIKAAPDGIRLASNPLRDWQAFVACELCFLWLFKWLFGFSRMHLDFGALFHEELCQRAYAYAYEHACFLHESACSVWWGLITCKTWTTRRIPCLIFSSVEYQQTQLHVIADCSSHLILRKFYCGSMIAAPIDAVFSQLGNLTELWATTHLSSWNPWWLGCAAIMHYWFVCLLWAAKDQFENKQMKTMILIFVLFVGLFLAAD